MREEVNLANQGKQLSQLEKDRLFIKEATQAIAQYDSYDLLLKYLDDVWVHRKRLALVRPVQYEDNNVGSPPLPPNDPSHTSVWIVDSTDAKTVVRKVLDSYVDLGRFIPRIESKGLNFNKSGVVRFVLSGTDEIKRIPLKLDSALSSLWMHASVLGRPVEIITMRNFLERFRDDGFFYGPWLPHPPKIETVEIALRVAPDSTVTYEILSDEISSTLKSRLSSEIDEARKKY